MIIGESSRISTISNSANDITGKIGTSPFNIKTTFRGASSNTKTMMNNTKEPKTGEDLNNWEYCNPDKLGDKLPQPYRYITSSLSSFI